MGSQLFIKSVTINMSANVEKSAKPKKAKTTTKKVDAAAHPPSSVMVVKAIEDLKERKGSSLAAIKKYIGANYKVDLAKVSVFIRKAFKGNRESKKRLWLLALVWGDDSRLRKQRASRSQRRLPRRLPLQRKRPRNLLLKRQHLKRLKKQSRQQRQRQPSLRNPWQRNRRKSQLLKRRRPRKSSD